MQKDMNEVLNNDFNELKKNVDIKVDNYYDFVKKYYNLVYLSNTIKEMGSDDFDVVDKTFPYAKRELNYISSFIKNLKPLFDEGKMNMSADEFIKQTLSKDDAKTVLSRSTTTFGVTPSMAEEILEKMSDIYEKNKAIMDEYIRNFELTYKTVYEKEEKEYDNNLIIKKTLDDPSVIDTMVNDTKVDKQQYINDLTEAVEITGKYSSEYSNVTDSRRTALEHTNLMVEKKGVDKALELLSENEKKAFDNRDILVYDGFETKEELDALKKKYPFKIGDDKKKQIKEVLDKMEEYGFTSDIFVGESGAKIYGFTNYIGLKEQIASTNDPVKLHKLLEAFHTEEKHLNEVITMCEERFGNKNYPGNLDVSRNSLIDTKLSSRLAGTSWFNALYLLNNMAKSNNMEFDFDDPVGFIGKVLAELSPKFCYNVIKGKSHAEQFDYLTKDHGEQTIETYGYGRAVNLLKLIDAGNPSLNLLESYITSLATSTTFFVQNKVVGNDPADPVSPYNRFVGLMINDEFKSEYVDGVVDPLTGVLIKYDAVEAIKSTEIDLNKLQAKILSDIAILQDRESKGDIGMDGNFLPESFSKLASQILENKEIKNGFDALFLNELKQVDSLEKLLKYPVNQITLNALKTDFLNNAEYLESENFDEAAMEAKISSNIDMLLSLSNDNKISAPSAEFLLNELKGLANNILPSGKIENSINKTFYEGLLECDSMKDLNDFKTAYAEKKPMIDKFISHFPEGGEITFKKFDGTKITASEAVLATNNHEFIQVYNDGVLSGVSYGPAANEYREYNLSHLVDSEKRNIARFLNKMENTLKRHNPWYMRFRNAVSGNKYSEIIDKIKEVKKSNFDNPEVLREGLKQIADKAEKYFSGKLTDGKSETELNENRKGAALRVFAACRNAQTSYDFMQAPLENSQNESLIVPIEIPEANDEIINTNVIDKSFVQENINEKEKIEELK